MKFLKITSAMLIIMALAHGRLMAQSEQLAVPLSDPGKPYKLEVSIISGSIKVIGYEGREVIIDVQTEGRKDEHDHKTGMRRISGSEAMEVTAKEKNNQVTVSTGMPGKTINLVIKVPQRQGSFKLSTINDGGITVSNLSGDLEISNVNGAIRLGGISGSVVANTVNGDVIVTFRGVDPKAAMAFTTLNGNVDVTFPAGLRANMKLKSDHGDIFTDFDMVTEKRIPAANKSGKDGMYRINVDDWVYGKIDGGGPEMMMKNMNGDIFIRKAK